MRRLFIVGSDAFIVRAMRFALQYAPGLSLSGVIDGQAHMRRAIREAEPDVVIVDGLTNERPPLARLTEIRAEASHALVILLSAPLEEASLNVALAAGALVCMSSSLRVSEVPVQADELAPALAGRVQVPEVFDEESAADAGTPGLSEPARLTARELEVLRAAAKGHTNARIGRDLWVTEQTVKFHLSNIYRKAGVSNRTEAIRYALMHGLVAMPHQRAAALRPLAVGGRAT
jgi:DNA-binding NarL/FixJ family response regulator